jgi:hypothetical protein
VGGRLLADRFERLTALPFAHPAANERRQIAAAGLTEVNSDIRSLGAGPRATDIAHTCHLPWDRPIK